MDIPTLPASDAKLAENTLSTALATSDVVLDAIFGFSFKPPVRAPFDVALPLIARAGLPIVSVDIPSGWDVERGDAAELGLHPDVLVSLTAPKEGVRKFTGRHFLGGRFVPKYGNKKLLFAQ
jgi:NAD(P)H-hydrate epimerase